MDDMKTQQIHGMVMSYDGGNWGINGGYREIEEELQRSW